MANPALKNGYISIANELVEKLASVSIPCSEMRLVWVVWRKTWGWAEGSRKKDWDWIALSQFSKMTGIKHANVVSSLKSLVCKHILLKEENRYKFNQNYEQWLVCKRIRVVCNNIQGSMQTHTKTSMQTHTNKRNKETIQKKERKEDSEPSSQEIPLLIKSFESINPACKNYYGNKTQRKACQFLIDTYGFERVKIVVEKTLAKTNTIKYFPIITTPQQLQEKWATLESKVKSYQVEKMQEKEKYKVAFNG